MEKGAQRKNNADTYKKGRDGACRRKQADADRKDLCPVQRQCGGCKWLSEPYEVQLARKERYVKERCGSFGSFEPIVGMEDPYHYRNKVHAVFGEGKGRRIISGIYEENTHRIVPVDACLLENGKADEIILSVRELMRSFKLRPYNEDTGYGLVRHVLVRTGLYTGQIMVVLVLASPILPSKNHFVKALLQLHPEITTIVLNVNPRGTSMVLGTRDIVLYGKGYIEDTLCGKTFRISPQSFYQVNPVQTQKLYGKAIAFAGLTGKELVLDAYCGTGTIGLIAAGRAREVIGVESNRAAVRDARANAAANKIANITFYEADAGRFMEEAAEQGRRVDVVFMDPPRAGSDEAFLSSLTRLKPARIVYISCNPETLARDLRFLTRRGYRMREGAIYDMFPWAGHVETVVLLSQQKPDDYVEVNLELDELDITCAESKATYEEIKKYIADHNNGLKVSSLNIAQVKKKYGIEMGKNYNQPKSADSRQPKCSKEKEMIIEEALRHFGMI